MSAKSDINVTPLIDIVLVLLIIFIVMVPGMSKALAVVVPQIVKKDKANPTPANQPPQLVIEVEPDEENKGYLYKLQNREFDLGEISSQLTPVVQLQPIGMRKVFVKVDEDVPYQVVIHVLDQVRLASERAKKESLAKLGTDGGDTKVVTSLKKR